MGHRGGGTGAGAGAMGAEWGGMGGMGGGDSCRDPVESLSVEEVARRCDAVSEVEVVYKIVRHLAANERVILIPGKDGNPRNAVVVSEECPVDDGEQGGEDV